VTGDMHVIYSVIHTRSKDTNATQYTGFTVARSHVINEMTSFAVSIEDIDRQSINQSIN